MRKPGPEILVVDASVAVKWYVPEDHSEAAASLLRSDVELHVPTYLFVEAASVLQKKVAIESLLSESVAVEAFQHLQSVPLTCHATEPLLEVAMRHGIRFRRPVYDCLYLVLAQALDGRVVTADRRLFRGIQGGPFEHLVAWIGDLAL